MLIHKPSNNLHTVNDSLEALDSFFDLPVLCQLIRLKYYVCTDYSRKYGNTVCDDMLKSLLLYCSSTFKDQKNQLVLDQLINEVRKSNPAFQAAQIRGE